MIFENLEFFNAAEVQESRSGVRLYRFPRAVCDAMGEPGRRYGRYVSQTTTGCEIRFVTDGDRARISLTSLDFDGYVQVFCGDFAYYEGYVYQFPVYRDRVTTIELIRPKLFDHLPEPYQKGAFSPCVWRILCGINMTLAVRDFEAYGFAVRPPKAEEVPAKTLLCYGTSLTYGACANAHGVAYVQLLGRLLGCNILNKAMGGSCMNENAVADYFTSGTEHFDAVLLENGVNMSGLESYRPQCENLLQKLYHTYPEKPVYCVTSYPNSDNLSGGRAVPCGTCTKDPDFKFQNDNILRGLVSQFPNCRLIEGADVMNEATALTVDGIHLSDYGHILLAHHLAQRIQLR